MTRPAFVAEVSSNHHADLDRSLAFVERAAELGCAAVKFQQFRLRELFAPEALAANPALLERETWELPEAFNGTLAERAHSLGLQYASTPFYRAAVELLAPHVDFFKVASYQVPWLELLALVAQTQKPVVLSTGMADVSELDAAVETLRANGCAELTLLHCVSSYPAAPEAARLASIESLRARYGVPVGWSDHTVSAAVVRRAVRRFRACMIEFHLDLDREGAEYGGGHCWLPEEIAAAMAAAIGGDEARSRDANGPEPATSPFDGDGAIGPSADEAHERRWRSDPSDGLRPMLRERRALA